MPWSARTIGAAVLIGFGLRGPLSGQILRGRVIGDRGAVAGAALRMIDDSTRIVATALADTDGVFTLRAPRAGEYRVLVSRIGYDSLFAGPVRLRANGFAEVTITLEARAIRLDTLDVTVPGGAVPALRRNGFYDRKKLGHGYFVESADIDKLHAQRASEVFARVPGVRVVKQDGFADVWLRNASTDFGNQICPPLIFLDGLSMVAPEMPRPRRNVEERLGRGRYNLEDLPAADIEAIEVYSGLGSLPSEFARDGTTCGAVLIWTKK